MEFPFRIIRVYKTVFLVRLRLWLCCHSEKAKVAKGEAREKGNVDLSLLTDLAEVVDDYVFVVVRV